MPIIPSLVTNEENQTPLVPLSTKEIKDAIFSMDQASVTGPDGFPGSFYYDCSEIMSQDVVVVDKEFFLEFWIP